MKAKSNKKKKSPKTYVIYAIYDIKKKEITAVSLEFDMLQMQLDIDDVDGYEIIEFDLKLM